MRSSAAWAFRLHVCLAALRREAGCDDSGKALETGCPWAPSWPGAAARAMVPGDHGTTMAAIRW